MGWFRLKLTREQRVEGKVNALFSVLMNDDDFEFTYSERVQITQQFKSKVEEFLIQEGILLEQQQSELQLTVARLRAALNTLQNG
jgi:hypothetical protein